MRDWVEQFFHGLGLRYFRQEYNMSIWGSVAPIIDGVGDSLLDFVEWGERTSEPDVYGQERILDWIQLVRFLAWRM